MNSAQIATSEEPFSIILMIGDGMGPMQVELARLVEFGPSGNLTMQQSGLFLSVETYSADSSVTDSAAAATAMATGEKTNNGMLSILQNGTSVETILEIAQARGKATGILATSYIQHATPAAFMTHVSNRNDLSEITSQIVTSEVDVIMGGGLTYFSQSQLASMESNGYSIVHNRTELLDIDSGRILGLFSNGHMEYETDRIFSLTPSLAEMTNKSLEVLSQDTDGFFLMVEGSKVDFEAHANDRVGTSLEAIAFDEAVKVALDYVENHQNTVLIVTADHETGGLGIVSNTLSDELPSSVGDEEARRTLRVERAQNVTVTWSTTGHTATSVPLYCFGSLFEGLSNGSLVDNTEIFVQMNALIADEPTVTPTDTDTTTSTSTTTPTGTEPSTPTTPTSFDGTLTLIVGISIIAIAMIVIVFIIQKRR
ncbi:MAG: alkaline phosphatase [Candidatus Thorarchaeota archaeon]